MKSELPLFPEAASSNAAQVDALYLIWTAVSLFFAVLIGVLIVVFMVKYRRKHADEVGLREKEAPLLEIVWSAIPLIIALGMFGWGTRVYFDLVRPPSDAVEYFAVGKQWMWKFQHPEGVREINQLHVPVGQSIKLTITSEDVIHSVYFPAFRTKQDAVPGRYTNLWFKATKTGTYHLFCAEYCGTEHSKMIGQVTVMEPQDYEAWLASGGQATAASTPVASGAQLFSTYAFDTCHRDVNDPRPPRAPQLAGLFGTEVALSDGKTALVDDTYLRESILNPQAKMVAGWDPIMPTFQGQISEEQLAQLLAYIKSLEAGNATAAAPAAATPATSDAVRGTL